MKSLISKIPPTVKAALARAGWTFLVVLVPALGTGASTDLDYVTAANIAAGAAILSFIKSLIVGMPETTFATVEPFTADVTGDPMLRVLTRTDELHLQAPAPEAPTAPIDATEVGTAPPVTGGRKFKQRT